MRFQATYCAMLAVFIPSAAILTAPTSAVADTVQAPVERVFVPAVGYDDNDNVQIRVEGTLPDACYVLGKPRIKQSSDGTIFTIRESARRREDGACGSGDLLPETTYSVDVSLGQLPVGDYRITQTSEDGVVTYVSFNVAPAKSLWIDNHYANVTQVSVADVVDQGQDVTVTFQGLYSSSCTALENPISVQRVGDVFVIRPIEVQEPGVSCDTMILRFFTQTVHLGPQLPGEYLVQIRSKDWRVVDQTFQVLTL